jgi:hypothetical protein
MSSAEPTTGPAAHGPFTRNHGRQLMYPLTDPDTRRPSRDLFAHASTFAEAASEAAGALRLGLAPNNPAMKSATQRGAGEFVGVGDIPQGAGLSVAHRDGHDSRHHLPISVAGGATGGVAAQFAVDQS